jgi:excisionase family DNA binding protein
MSGSLTNAPTGLRTATAGESHLHQLLTPDQLSDWLQVPKQTVYRWRTRGDGPRGFRVGKHLRFDRGDVEQWLMTQRDG